MKPWLSLLFILLLFSCSAQEVVDSKNREIVFQSVNVIPMDREAVLENQVVVVRNGVITAVGDAKKVKWNKDALIIDAKGKYLIPGLAEMHAHVPPIDDIEPMKEVLLLFAANGITTIRGMLGHPRHLELRSKVKSGEILGPHFITSGPSFNGNTVTSPEVGAQMVRQQKEAGYDFLKMHPGLTKEKFAAMAQTAKEVGIPFAGHVSFDVGIQRAIDAGYATIDHLDGFIEGLVPNIETTTEQQNGLFAMFLADKADTIRIPQLMKGLREKNVWVVPTQALAERWFAPVDVETLRNEPEMIYMDKKTLDNWTNTKKNLHNNPAYNAEAINRFIQLRRKLIYECQKNGVGLLLGSDAPQIFDVPGFSAHHELKYMVDAGLTPYQALQMATTNVAKFYKQTNAGIIKNGAVADLVLLNNNPLTDIKNTRNIDGVLLNGRWLSKAWIDQTLKSLEKK